MKLRSVTYALFIAGLAAFSTSSLAAQSLRFGGNDSNLLIVFYVQIMPDD
ncbi:hypothetical protein FSF26_019450, partial [Escherichia coli]|nr:hypothetical protein [Escherichia coli]